MRCFEIKASGIKRPVDFPGFTPRNYYPEISRGFCNRPRLLATLSETKEMRHSLYGKTVCSVVGTINFCLQGSYVHVCYQPGQATWRIGSKVYVLNFFGGGPVRYSKKSSSVPCRISYRWIFFRYSGALTTGLVIPLTQPHPTFNFVER